MSDQALQEDPKKKKKKLDYAEIIEDAKRELAECEKTYTNDVKEAEEKREKRKSEIVNDLADQLSKIPGIEQHKISIIIKQELKGLVSESYINDVLPPEYKNENQSNRAKGKSKGNGDNDEESGNGNAAGSEGNETLPGTEELTEDEKRVEKWGKWHIKPSEYSPDDLHKYTHDLLESIIRHKEREEIELLERITNYEGRLNTSKEKIAELKKEIAELKGEGKGNAN
jgi:hypothetical protein